MGKGGNSGTDIHCSLCDLQQISYLTSWAFGFFICKSRMMPPPDMCEVCKLLTLSCVYVIVPRVFVIVHHRYVIVPHEHVIKPR